MKIGERLHAPPIEKDLQKKTKQKEPFLKTVLIAVFLALIFRSVLYQTFVIPSGSMIPQLLVGDYLFVSKYTYGYSKYSFPSPTGFMDDRQFFPLVPFSGRIGPSNRPKRGEVVVFRFKNHHNTDYIKRVVGLPGDRIQMKEGILHINHVPCKVRKIQDYTYVDEKDRSITVEQYMETLPNGVEHPILKHVPFGQAPDDNTPVYVVPAQHYFMMGDNRDQSADSRRVHTMGIVPEENLVGRAEMRWFSMENSSLWQIWKWPTHGRFKRMFTLIS